MQVLIVLHAPIITYKIYCYLRDVLPAVSRNIEILFKCYPMNLCINCILHMEAYWTYDSVELCILYRFWMIFCPCLHILSFVSCMNFIKFSPSMGSVYWFRSPPGICAFLVLCLLLCQVWSVTLCTMLHVMSWHLVMTFYFSFVWLANAYCVFQLLIIQSNTRWTLYNIYLTIYTYLHLISMV